MACEHPHHMHEMPTACTAAPLTQVWLLLRLLLLLQVVYVEGVVDKLLAGHNHMQLRCCLISGCRYNCCAGGVLGGCGGQAAGWPQSYAVALLSHFWLPLQLLRRWCTWRMWWTSCWLATATAANTKPCWHSTRREASHHWPRWGRVALHAAACCVYVPGRVGVCFWSLPANLPCCVLQLMTGLLPPLLVCTARFILMQYTASVVGS
jgi:hypothetical protein